MNNVHFYDLLKKLNRKMRLFEVLLTGGRQFVTCQELSMKIVSWEEC